MPITIASAEMSVIFSFAVETGIGPENESRQGTKRDSFYRYTPAPCFGSQNTATQISLDRHGSHRRFVGSLLRQLLEDFEEDVVGVESFGLSLEVKNDAVAQRGQIDAADIFEADVVAAFEEGPHF